MYSLSRPSKIVKEAFVFAVEALALPYQVYFAELLKLEVRERLKATK